MEFEKTDIPGVILIKPKVWGDKRGFFYESYRKDLAQQAGIEIDFVQDNYSKSKKGILRGLHYQIENQQAKLVTCVSGAVLDVCVDIRKGSPSFGKSFSVELNDENRWQLFIPKGLAHGFLVLSESADFTYKCSNYYLPTAERGILWNDESLNIQWNCSAPVLSEKDTKHPRLNEIKQEDLPEYHG